MESKRIQRKTYPLKWNSIFSSRELLQSRIGIKLVPPCVEMFSLQRHPFSPLQGFWLFCIIMIPTILSGAIHFTICQSWVHILPQVLLFFRVLPVPRCPPGASAPNVLCYSLCWPGHPIIPVWIWKIKTIPLAHCCICSIANSSIPRLVDPTSLYSSLTGIYNRQIWTSWKIRNKFIISTFCSWVVLMSRLIWFLYLRTLDFLWKLVEYHPTRIIIRAYDLHSLPPFAMQTIHMMGLSWIRHAPKSTFSWS